MRPRSFGTDFNIDIVEESGVWQDPPSSMRRYLYLPCAVFHTLSRCEIQVYSKKNDWDVRMRSTFAACCRLSSELKWRNLI